MSKFKFRDLKITVKMGGDDGSSSVRELFYVLSPQIFDPTPPPSLPRTSEPGYALGGTSSPREI